MTAEVRRRSKNAATAGAHDATCNRDVSVCVRTMDGGEDYGERNTARNR